MSVLGNNIRFLRKNKGLTQEELAKGIGVKRSVIGTYEEGRAEPRLDTLKTLSIYFKLTIDELLNSNLDVQIKPAGNIHGTDLRVLTVTVDVNNDELINLIPEKAAAGYLAGYSDPEYVDEMPRFSLQFPELNRSKTHRIFQSNGDSMLPITSGAYLICEYLQNWDFAKNGELIICASLGEGLVFKRFVEINRNKGVLAMSSDNKSFSGIEIELSDVQEIWTVKGICTFDLGNISHEEIEYDSIKAELKEINKKLDARAI